ncbi:hypothetical protein BBJ29_005466 [Phytophthora kernoviae]|uniref:Uncharacterized protein n=1 Tax=Phytophthora kernoviae TaxID=325452 RepID=A0A3F2RI80_9STRA|nr:hypothetical protein BBP00_00007639 [Phytophthora kernoviae]RLN70010.1 hypothetical protein BBJ29_005466 [Phytophthora kernoviae]
MVIEVDAGLVVTGLVVTGLVVVVVSSVSVRVLPPSTEDVTVDTSEVTASAAVSSAPATIPWASSNEMRCRDGSSAVQWAIVATKSPSASTPRRLRLMALDQLHRHTGGHHYTYLGLEDM